MRSAFFFTLHMFCRQLAPAMMLAALWTSPAYAQLADPDADIRNTRLRTAGLMGGGALALALYGRAKWWDQGFQSTLSSEHEGWFGQRTYSGGADKLGHFYMNYAGTRLMARALGWAGNPPDTALRMAAVYTLGTFAAIEVLDGYSKQWNFSREDMVMNAAGAGFGVLLESHPALDRVLDFRILYKPSREEGASFDPFGDYSGQKYLLVAKAGGVPALHQHRWLRYVEVAAGYGTRGYNRDIGQYGTRSLYLGVSFNLAELLNGSPRQPPGRLQRAASTALEFVQVPGTAALDRTDLSRD